MGLLNRDPWLIRIMWVVVHICSRANTDGSNLSVSFVEAPPTVSSSDRATFVFEVFVGGRENGCQGCSIKCKLDNQQFSSCEARQASFWNLQDGSHKFEVCVVSFQADGCDSYSWVVDTVPPTAYITAERSFTNAENVSVSISFTEPCTSGGRFGCSSVNACNLLVYGAGQVIPSSLKIIQPNIKFSLLVRLSESVQYGRVVLAMDKGFCSDRAGNVFARTANSTFFVHFDRREVLVTLTTHIPEKLVEISSETRTVQATNSDRKLKIFLYFSSPVLNTSAEVLSVLRSSVGVLLPGNGRSLGNRRFDYTLENISSVAIVTTTIDTSSIISRQGTIVSSTGPITFLYDSQRPSVRLSTSSSMRTRKRTLPVFIRFLKPVFDFNTSGISVTGGYLHNFQEVSRSIYIVEIHAYGEMILVNIPENTTRDIAGNLNLPSNLLQVKHYSVPLISTLLSTLVTATFAATSAIAGLLTLSTASLQSLGELKRQSPQLTSEPTRNLFRIAYHIQIFALSRWLVAVMPVEYYEFVRGLQWSIPYLPLPWETDHVQSLMLNSSPPISTHAVIPEKQYKAASSTSNRDSLIYGLPLSPMEYGTYFESQTMKPEAEFVAEAQGTDRWRLFYRNIVWLALIGSGMVIVHIFLFLVLKFRKRSTEKQKNYGALVLPRFEIFLIILALPCLCQASATILKGGSTPEIIVGGFLLATTSFLLLVVFLFISIGITFGKLLQYKEVHQEGQESYWYQEIEKAILGPGKRGQWTWKDEPNSINLTRLGPLFEDLRGPPKYMLSQIAGGDVKKVSERNQIIASDDETEDAEAPFIQKIFGILRIYYTLLESVKRVALGIVAGFALDDASSKFPALVVLSVTAFQLLFLALKKPFIKKKVQLVELLSVSSELVVFFICLYLHSKDLSSTQERRVGVSMVVLFMVAFTAQMVNEWYALYKQGMKLAPVENSFISGLKAVFIGIMLLVFPGKLLKSLNNKLGNCGSSEEAREAISSSEMERSSQGGGNSNTGEKPWLRQLRELAIASFSKEEEGGGGGGGGGGGDPSTSRRQVGFRVGRGVEAPL